MSENLDMTHSGAEFSPCRKYRYKLWRVWDPNKPYVVFIGLNPSTADETINDPTVAKCQRLAKRWGFGGLFMANIFAFRATDPRVMKMEVEPVGQDNDQAIKDMIDASEQVICAWGNHGEHNGRSRQMNELLDSMNSFLSRKFFCFKRNKNGEPAHPLYQKEDSTLIAFFEIREWKNV